MRRKVVGIVGSRYWLDYDAFKAALPKMSWVDTIVSGGACGVDEMAKRWAEENDRAYVEFHVKRHRAALGFTMAAHLRNQEIADFLGEMNGELIAMPGPDSRGTWDTVNRCKALGVPVTVVEVAK